ncbi:MAG TPA: sensor histidine kinase [Actinomycetota bacterium]|nr:sensor histidine kinase [Actinomycetota bacterium]
MARPLRLAAPDVGLALALGAVFLASTLANSEDGRSLDGLGWLLVAVNTLPILAVRSHPFSVLATFALAYPLWATFEYPGDILQSLPTMAAMAAVGAAPKPLAVRALGLIPPAEMLAFVLFGGWDVDVLMIGYVAVVFVVVWALGVALAARREYSRQLEEKTLALEAAREELARSAVVEERTRIARDLHDVLGHAMSLITVQAGVGAHLIDRDPEQAERALKIIEETGRGALGEMRRVLTALRSDETPTEPRPTLNSLPELVEKTRSAGLPVELRIRGDVRTLPPGLELSAYRIVQEALTNALKHASGSRATLTLTYKPEVIEIQVTNVGGTHTSSANRSGHGLNGMRERVAIYGGSLEAGAIDDGFKVLATIPANDQ